jgi:hypothetical protein
VGWGGVRVGCGWGGRRARAGRGEAAVQRPRRGKSGCAREAWALDTGTGRGRGLSLGYQGRRGSAAASPCRAPLPTTPPVPPPPPPQPPLPSRVNTARPPAAASRHPRRRLTRKRAAEAVQQREQLVVGHLDRTLDAAAAYGVVVVVRHLARPDPGGAGGGGRGRKQGARDGRFQAGVDGYQEGGSVAWAAALLPLPLAVALLLLLLLRQRRPPPFLSAAPPTCPAYLC